MYIRLRENNYLVYIFALIILIIFQEWGSFSDHLAWDTIYSGDFDYFYIGVVFENLIKIFNILEIPSELFWKLISIFNAILIMSFANKILSKFENKERYNLSIFLFFVLIALPFSLYNIRAGLGIAFFIISFYYSIEKRYVLTFLFLIISFLTHIQFFIPSLIMVLDIFLIDFNSLKNIFNKDKKLNTLLIVFLIFFLAFLFINFQLLINYFEKLISYFDLYVLNFKFYSFKKILYTSSSSFYYLLLIIPSIYTNLCSDKIYCLKSNKRSTYLVLTIIPKIIFQPFFALSRVFSSFNFIYIISFYNTKKDFKNLIINQIYKYSLLAGAVFTLVRYLKFYKLSF